MTFNFRPAASKTTARFIVFASDGTCWLRRSRSRGLTPLEVGELYDSQATA